jgi:hypothetical protein
MWVDSWRYGSLPNKQSARNESTKCTSVESSHKVNANQYTVRHAIAGILQTMFTGRFAWRLPL